ncbi:MAG: [protein-PII] uridylyltransferase [Rhizobiaceae bacterium]
MAKSDPHLSSLIDSDQLRRDLTALTTDSDGDGSDSKIRQQVLALLKQVSQEGRQKVETLLMDDGAGNQCARRLSHLQDELIRCLYDFAIVHVFRAANLSAGERMAIISVGGYGRGTLAPGSDLDLLFLLPYKQTALGESIVEYMLYMLWDMGYKVGHATRNVDQCISLSKDDLTIRTSILEARFLWGEQSLYDELVERFDKDLMQKTAPEFIAAKLAERDTRHQKSGQSRYLVEPNVKDGKGGLRDLHTLFWISKYYFRVRTQNELRAKKVFSASEFRRFMKAQDFLWAVRCHLHFLTGRAEERLSFDLQAQLAERLGYLDHPGLSAVERFMKHYFLIAKDVGDLTRILCATLEAQQAKEASGISGIFRSLTNRPKKIRGTDDFVNLNNRIQLVEDDVFTKDPVNILRMFQLAEEHGLLFHPDIMHLVSRSLKLIDKKLRHDPAANAAFLATLTSRKTPERTLRKMNESGVLGRFLPEFGKIVAMMQFNMYHHYTVDEHLLRSIGILSEIEHGEVGEQHPLANEIMKNSPNRVVLYVALLLHDIAKGRPEDHSIVGAAIARRVCPRLGLDKHQTELVAWLVEHHLLMSNTAQSRDLNDPKTIADFASVMQTFERMKALLVLTVCDIKAVGPGVWNGWKGQLLRTLFYMCEPQLTGGFTQTPRREQIAEVRRELNDALADWSEDQRNRVIDLHYDNYLLTVPREDQIRHLKFIRDTDEKGLATATTIETRDFEAITEITLLAPDHPRLLSTITGCCAAAGANIVDAQIFTTRDGRALDSIFINRLYDDPRDERRRAQHIADTIQKVLTGKTRLSKLLADKAKPKRRSAAFKVEPSVMINNELSDKFTVIELEALDRPGLLSDVTDALADLSLDIASAHIATFGEKVIDSFYATDLVGFKITSPQKLAAIKRKLMAALGATAVEGPKAPAKRGAKGSSKTSAKSGVA